MFENLMQNDLWINSWPWHVQMIVLLIVLRTLKTSSVRYYLHYAAYPVIAMSLATIYMFIFLLRPKNPANFTLATPAASIVSRMFGIHWELRGGKHLETGEAGVLVANHQSIFDMLGFLEFGYSIKRAIAVARKEVFYFLPFGISSWLAGVLFINRHDRKKSLEDLMGTRTLLKKEKAKLIVFPEGTRNRNGETLLPFKTGAFRVAISSQIPIYPVVFSDYYFIDSNKRTFDKGRMIVSALPPIPTEGLTMNDMDALVKKTWTIMQDHYKLLREEVRKQKTKEESLDHGMQ